MTDASVTIYLLATVLALMATAGVFFAVLRVFYNHVLSLT